MPPSVCSIYVGGSSRDAGAGMLFCECSLFSSASWQIQLEVQKALDDTGRKLAVCAAAVSSDGAALPGIAEALLLREMADRTEAENLHHRRKVWNQPDRIRFLRGGGSHCGRRIISGCPSDLLVVGFCDGTAGRL